MGLINEQLMDDLKLCKIVELNNKIDLNACRNNSLRDHHKKITNYFEIKSTFTYLCFEINNHQKK